MDAFISSGSLSIKTLAPHRNLGMEIHYVSKGHFRWVVDGREEILLPGSVFFTLPWQAHGSTQPCEPGNMIHWILFKLDRVYMSPADTFGFHESLAFPEDAAEKIAPVFCAAQKHAWRSTPAMRRMLLTLIHELDEQDDNSEIVIQGLFRAAIVELFRIVSDPYMSSPAPAPAPKRVLAFLEELSERCHEPWTLDSMAAHCGLKRSQFTEYVRKRTGHPPLTHLNQVRIARAKSMLLGTGKNVTQIAMENGFSTSQYFAKVFRSMTGITPSAYRANPEAAFETWTEVPWRSEEEEDARLRLFKGEEGGVTA
jgi:AraC family L-rhamnose operon regulatory protein RhaS